MWWAGDRTSLARLGRCGRHGRHSRDPGERCRVAASRQRRRLGRRLIRPGGNSPVRGTAYARRLDSASSALDGSHASDRPGRRRCGARLRSPRLSLLRPTGCSPTTTATHPDAVRATDRPQARSADSVTPLRRRRFWSSATRTSRCGFRRCSRSTTGPLRRHAAIKQGYTPPDALPPGARQNVSAGSGGRSARCRS